MLHKELASSAKSLQNPATDRGLYLAHPAAPLSFLAPAADLVPILSRRCSWFCAEAAVLVLVFGILDYFMMKGRIELPWIASALSISVLLLALSVVIELSGQRWMKAHP